MQTKSYNEEIVVNVNPEAAFKAITNEVDQWWGSVSNGVLKEGDTFTKFFDETHWTFRVTGYAPFSAIDMECIEAHHIDEGLPDTIREEWLGTTLHWKLNEVEGGTRIRFVHDGLVQELECYDVCAAGWDHFFVNGLKVYLNEGISV